MGARLGLGILKPNPAACGGLGLTVHEQPLPSKIPVSLLWPLSLPVLYPGPSPIPTPTSPAAQLLDRLSISGLWLYSFYTHPHLLAISPALSISPIASPFPVSGLTLG